MRARAFRQSLLVADSAVRADSRAALKPGETSCGFQFGSTHAPLSRPARSDGPARALARSHRSYTAESETANQRSRRLSNSRFDTHATTQRNGTNASVSTGAARKSSAFSLVH